MEIWTGEEIKKILLELDAMGLPSKKYSIQSKDGSVNLLGKGGSANVYEAWTRRGGKSGYAMKLLISPIQNRDREFFEHSVEVQKELALLEDDVVKIFEHRELWISFNENGNILSVNKEISEEMLKNTVVFQFILMEKLSVILEKMKNGGIKMTPESLAFGEEKEILKLAYDIGSVLARAHAQKVLHRDIKLENIFYEEKKQLYKLGDFGIAKKTEDGFAGTVAFTKGYAAPEVLGTVENDRYDNTADIYSFGMTLFVLANGLRFPCSGNYRVNTLQYCPGYILPKPENPNISEAFYNIMEKACRYNPEERYQSMEDMLIDLEALLFGAYFAHKKKHRTTTLIFGAIYLMAGIVGWKFLMVESFYMNFTPWDDLFLFSYVMQGLLRFLKKDLPWLSYLQLAFAGFLIYVHGFSMALLGLLLFMALIPKELSGIIAAGVLFFSGGFGFDNGHVSYAYTKHNWWVVLSFTIGITLINQYTLMIGKAKPQKIKAFQKASNWKVFILFYIMLFIVDFLFYVINWDPVEKLIGTGAMDVIRMMHTGPLILGGMAVGVFMWLRDRILM